MSDITNSLKAAREQLWKIGFEEDARYRSECDAHIEDAIVLANRVERQLEQAESELATLREWQNWPPEDISLFGKEQICWLEFEVEREIEVVIGRVSYFEPTKKWIIEGALQDIPTLVFSGSNPCNLHNELRGKLLRYSGPFRSPKGTV